MTVSLKKIKNQLQVNIIMAKADNIPQYRKNHWRDKGLRLAEVLHDANAISDADYYEYRATIRAAAETPTANQELEQDYLNA